MRWKSVTGLAVLLAAAACGGGSGMSGGSSGDGGNGSDGGIGDGGSSDGGIDGSDGGGADPCAGVTCSGHGTCVAVAGTAACTCDSGYLRSGATACISTSSPALGGCQLFPANHIFNTPIDSLPADPNSAAYLQTIGAAGVHLDLGTETEQAASDYYGIPYNLTHGNSLTWPQTRYYSADSSLDWDPRAESDCDAGASHSLVSPCTAGNAPSPLFPIPAQPLVEGGIDTDPSQPYGDHHTLILDVDQCRLWELYHVYPDAAQGWDIFGSASWDLNSNALRPAGWTSSDAAGFPILPLLLRETEAASGTIQHALRFTIPSGKIRNQYIWPARHLTDNGTDSTSLPPMGQLFRLRADYAIPAGDSAQSKAILQAMKTYGMYLADGGSTLYVQGEPNAVWDGNIFSELHAAQTSDFEAVDITAITGRNGFDPDSAAVP